MPFLAVTGFAGPASCEPAVVVWLSRTEPGRSHADLRDKAGKVLRFPVGFGKNGVKPEGSRFTGGWSLLGKFRIHAILTPDRFEMDPGQVADSGRTAAYLRERLFANMSSIDFDGDGRAGEYGGGYIGLWPDGEGGPEQPFHFGEYRGLFRWYGYALHGTQDEARVGKPVTGGCINLRGEDLLRVLSQVKLGDLVEVRELP